MRTASSKYAKSPRTGSAFARISEEAISNNTYNKYADYVKIRNEIREKVGNHIFKVTGCKPVILTVIQEIEVE